MKKWQYNGFDPVKKEFKQGWEKLDPVVWADNAPTEDYTDVTTNEDLKSRVQSIYSNKYRKDGEAYFDDIRADLVLLYQGGQKTEQEIYEVEDKLEPVISKLLRGDWMSAKNAILVVVPGGGLDQVLYDSIKLYINNYVVENYG